MDYTRVQRGEHPDRRSVKVWYTRKSDGWYVRTPVDDDYWKFAAPEADERTVIQLINKKWCELYAPEPDQFTDRE